METVIGRWDSSWALPYLIGTGYVAAETHQDRIIGTGTVNKLYLGFVLGSILIVGVIADVCILRLPGGVPLRDFGVLSSITIARPALHRLDSGMGHASDPNRFNSDQPSSDRPGPNQSESDTERPRSSGDPSWGPGLGPEFHMDLDTLKEKIRGVPIGAQIGRSLSSVLDEL